MILPRGPLIERGELSREWVRAFETLGRVPRETPDAVLQREWLHWFGDLGAGAIPRDPLYGADGTITRGWRVWLEAI